MYSANNEITREILNRLNKENKTIFLIDKYDDSTIVIDDELLEVIERYYRAKLQVKHG